SGALRPLHSFPTRRSSDLDALAALLDTMGVEGPVDVLGWSAGGNIVLQLAIDHPHLVRRIVLEAGGSPYGFGGTTGEDGRPVSRSEEHTSELQSRFDLVCR